MSYKESLQANNDELRNILSDIEDLPVAEGRSPFPIPVNSATEMDAILLNATADDIGAVYKYTGNTTKTYEQGKHYIIASAEAV